MSARGQQRDRDRNWRTGAEVKCVWAGFDPTRKRRRGLRILPDVRETGYYVHVISRIVGREFLLGEREKRHFYWLMQRLAEFSGIGVVTYCLMDNHFHLLLWVPQQKEIGYGEVVRRLGRIWSEDKVAAFTHDYENPLFSDEAKAALLASVTDRMGNLPEFMRLLKLQFTRWFNREHNRKGTLWESRYRSVVVEGTTRALTTVATYIDLNPVRAGLVEDPKDYRWSGYADAVRGNKSAQQGLTHLIQGINGAMPGIMQMTLIREAAERLEVADLWEPELRPNSKNLWRDVHGLYRCWLYAKGRHQRENINGNRRAQQRPGFDSSEVQQAFATRGALTPVVLASTRVKYLTRGLAIGSEEFLARLVQGHRSCFGPKRSKGGSRMKGDWGGLKVMRDSGG